MHLGEVGLQDGGAREVETLVLPVLGLTSPVPIPDGLAVPVPEWFHVTIAHGFSLPGQVRDFSRMRKVDLTFGKTYVTNYSVRLDVVADGLESLCDELQLPSPAQTYVTVAYATSEVRADWAREWAAGIDNPGCLSVSRLEHRRTGGARAPWGFDVLDFWMK